MVQQEKPAFGQPISECWFKSMQLPATAPGKEWRMARGLEPLQPRGRPGCEGRFQAIRR